MFRLQLQGASAELPRRVEALLSVSRMQVGVGGGSQSALLGPGKIDNQSLAEMHEVWFLALCLRSCIHDFRCAIFFKQKNNSFASVCNHGARLMEEWLPC